MNRNSIFVSALVEALARSGVGHACISPGSRNTPLSLAFAAHSDIVDWSHHDERSSAFFALGIAKTLHRPVAIVTTSGTAAAELLPAVAEADAAGVPLILLTADRPTELRDVAAAQTIDQRHLYGTRVRWHHDLDVPDPDDAGPARTAALGARLAAAATGPPAGPVHLNIRFREPLVVEPDFAGIEVPRHDAALAVPDAGQVASVLETVGGRTGVIVVGPSHDASLPAATVRLGKALGWPILSDPISGLRAGGHDVSGVVGSDLLAASGLVEQLAPEVAIRVGAPPTSKRLRAWLARSGTPQALVAGAGWPDPEASATVVLRAEPAAALTTLAESADNINDDSWLERWVEADRRASTAAAEAIASLDFPNEPAVAGALARAVPNDSAIWSGSSMPIRDLDSWFPVSERRVELLGNRGANGIDGLLSAALGTAATGTPTIAHAGDLSALHDVGALATAVRLSLPVTFLVVNNDGGGIFHFLPQDGHEHFERHFGTPHGLSFRDVAEGFGLDAVLVDTPDSLETAITDTASGPRLAEVRTDRRANVEVHREILSAVRAAL